MPVQCTVSDIMNTQTAWLPCLTLGLWINTGAGIHFCIHSLFILPFIAQRNTAVTDCRQKSRYTCITQDTTCLLNAKLFSTYLYRYRNKSQSKQRKRLVSLFYSTCSLSVWIFSSLFVFCQTAEAVVCFPAPCVPPSASWSLTAKEPVQPSDHLCCN